MDYYVHAVIRCEDDMWLCGAFILQSGSGTSFVRKVLCPREPRRQRADMECFAQPQNTNARLVTTLEWFGSETQPLGHPDR